MEFASDTDTEVAVHLVARQYQHGDTAAISRASVFAVLPRLEGHFTLVFANADEPGTIVAARRSTPLVLGVGDGEMFVGSDVAAFIEHTRHAVELGQDQAVVITADGYRISDFDGEDITDYREFHIDWDLSAAEKGGYEYFMLKEIAEQPAAVANTLLGHFVDGRIVLDEQRLSDQELREIDKVFVVACGTAYHSGLLAKYAIEHWTRLPVEVELASEFRYRDPVLDRSTLVVAISQSGETADTLEAVRHAKQQKAKVLAICNTNGSQIPRECDAVLYTRAGPEIGVAATKTFLAQIAANYLVGSGARAGPRHQVPRRGGARVPGAGVHARADVAGAGRSRTHRRVGPPVRAVVDGVVPRAATSATRWLWRVRSSSRNWPTCTPRASRPASSNTARSR